MPNRSPASCGRKENGSKSPTRPPSRPRMKGGVTPSRVCTWASAGAGGVVGVVGLGYVGLPFAVEKAKVGFHVVGVEQNPRRADQVNRGENYIGDVIDEELSDLVGKGLIRAVTSFDAVGDMDVIELNEAFAAQGLAVLRQLGIPDEDVRVNPNGGAIALGHPLGMSGARLALTATEELQRGGSRYGLATMCIGVGQGIALALERV